MSFLKNLELCTAWWTGWKPNTTPFINASALRICELELGIGFQDLKLKTHHNTPCHKGLQALSGAHRASATKIEDHERRVLVNINCFPAAVLSGIAACQEDLINRLFLHYFGRVECTYDCQ